MLYTMYYSNIRYVVYYAEYIPFATLYTVHFVLEAILHSLARANWMIDLYMMLSFAIFHMSFSLLNIQ